MTLMWQDPDYRAYTVNCVIHKARTPEARSAQSERMTLQWQDPDYRASMEGKAAATRKARDAADPGRTVRRAEKLTEKRAAGSWSNAWTEERKRAHSEKMREAHPNAVAWDADMDAVVLAADKLRVPGWRAVAIRVGVSPKALLRRRLELELKIKRKAPGEGRLEEKR